MALPMQSLLDTARVFLRTARQETEDGIATVDWVKIRDGAEKAWNSVLQATDHAMERHARTALPGRMAHADRREFLEAFGRVDLAQRFSYFADRLHGDILLRRQDCPGVDASAIA
jgi:hypothetical protein